jgi:hypothetical protein
METISLEEFKKLCQGKRRSRKRKPSGYRSELEAEFARYLEAAKSSGAVLAWQYEALTFHLGERASYTPDFLVLYPDGELELVEVKGWTQNLRDSRTKWKWAAECSPWATFVWATRRKGGGFHLEKYSSASRMLG